MGRFRSEEERIIEHSRELLAIFKLEHLAGETASSLPYGYQRGSRSRARWPPGPELLLLDEPAAGMNPAEIDQLMEFIQWIRREFRLTILLIEHQMKLVMGICERIQVLDFGKTLAQGSPEAVRNDPARARSLPRRKGGGMSSIEADLPAGAATACTSRFATCACTMTVSRPCTA